MEPKIVGISTCKGRLEHVKQSSKAFIDSANENTTYLLVDYNCPDKTGDWVLENYSKSKNAYALKTGEGQEYFHKTVALNAGAKYAIANFKPDYLMFFDADTIVKPGFFEYVKPFLDKDKFLIVKPSMNACDLTGFIIVPTGMFRDSGGYESSFRDWGIEDLEFRLRLYAKHNFKFDIIGFDYLSSIPHEDDLRVRFYCEKERFVSDARNLKRMRKMFEIYRGQNLEKYHEFSDSKEISVLLGEKE
jgi:predicted glycosyltransferase involved in capsule biosynthesis